MLLALALQVALASSEDGRGAPGLPPELAVARRALPRFHGAIGVGAGLQLARSASAGGLALSGELGVVVGDRVSVVLFGRASSIVFTAQGAVGARLDLPFGERWSLGLGAGLDGWLNVFPGTYGTWLGVTFPLRASYLLAERGPSEVARRGLVLALEVAPGFDVRPTAFFGGTISVPTEFGAALLLSIGYTTR